MRVYLSEIGTMSFMFKPLLKRGEYLIYEIKKYEKTAHAFKMQGVELFAVEFFSRILDFWFHLPAF